MKQLAIHNPQKLPKLPTTIHFLLLAMQDKYTLAQLRDLEQLLEEHQKAGFIVALEHTESESYREYQQKLIERLQAKQ